MREPVFYLKKLREDFVKPHALLVSILLIQNRDIHILNIITIV